MRLYYRGAARPIKENCRAWRLGGLKLPSLHWQSTALHLKQMQSLTTNSELRNGPKALRNVFPVLFENFRQTAAL
jgi:hypothetical protein